MANTLTNPEDIASKIAKEFEAYVEQFSEEIILLAKKEHPCSFTKDEDAIAG